MSTTIGGALSGRANALNALRLVLATAVIVGHSWPLGGFGDSGFEGLGGFAVDGFFCISGYLIAGSRVRLPIGRYLWNRVLRIFPAFLVCLVVTAFVFAPGVTLLHDQVWHASSSVDYVLRNASLWINQRGIDATLRSVPYRVAWNGSLWTLFYEFSAYLVAAVVLTPRFVRRRAPLACFGMLIGCAALIPAAHGPLHVTTNLYLNGLRLGVFFIAGMAVWSVKDRLTASAPLAAVCAAVVAIAWFQSEIVFQAIAALPLAYLLLWLGGRLPVRVGVDNDISYGMYIYAFPVQQVLATAGLQKLGLGAMIVGSTLCTIPLAALSWFGIERPALRLKNIRRPQTPRLAEIS